VKDGPDNDKAPLKLLTDFFSKYISVEIPQNDELLKVLVPKLQTHSHSVACSKHKNDSCRFHLPKTTIKSYIFASPSPNIANDSDCTSILKYKRDILKPVFDALHSNSYSSDIFLTEFLEKLNIDINEYHHAFSIGVKGLSYVIKQKLCEKFINNYNPIILKAWQAKMDIQPVLNTYACIMYIVSYVTKGERNMSELLRAAKKDFSICDIKTQLKLDV